MMALTIKMIVDDEDVEALLRLPHADRIHERLNRAFRSEFGSGAICIESTIAEPFVCAACHGDRFVCGVPCPECSP